MRASRYVVSETMDAKRFRGVAGIEALNFDAPFKFHAATGTVGFERLEPQHPFAASRFRWLVATAPGGAVAGYVLLTRKRGAKETYVNDVGVHPKHLRRGIASSLLTVACATAGPMWLKVDAANRGAIALYEKFGFRASGAVTDNGVTNGAQTVMKRPAVDGHHVVTGAAGWSAFERAVDGRGLYFRGTAVPPHGQTRARPRRYGQAGTKYVFATDLPALALSYCRKDSAKFAQLLEGDTCVLAFSGSRREFRACFPPRAFVYGYPAAGFSASPLPQLRGHEFVATRTQTPVVVCEVRNAAGVLEAIARRQPDKLRIMFQDHETSAPK